MPIGTKSPRSVALTLGFICLLGFSLRVYALDYGLPGVYNPDEVPILSRALALAQGDPNPHNFLYPSLHFYLLFAWEVLFFVGGWLVGTFQSLGDFQSRYFRDASGVILAGRALTAVCGTITLIAVYAIGRRLFDRPTGLAAAALLATAPFAVQDAHYIKLDVPVTMFSAFATAAMARLVVDSAAAATRRAWVVTGLLAGLAMSTQYYVIFLALSIAAVAVADIHRSGRWQTSAGLLAWAALGATAGFLIGTPFIVVEIDTAMRDIAGVREVDIDRALAGGGGAFTSLPAYLKLLAIDAMGWPVFASAALGTAWLLATDWRRGVVLVVFPVAYLTFIAHTVPMSRYVNCMLPMLVVLAAFPIVRMSRRVGGGTALTALLVAAAATPGLLNSVRAVRFYDQTDTRTFAREFIEREIASGESLLIQPYSAPIRRSREALVEALRTNLGSEEDASIKFQLELAIDPPLTPAYRTIYYGDGGTDPDKIYVLPREIDEHGDLTPLRRRGIRYVVLKRGNIPNPETAALERALARDGRLLTRVSPYRADAPAERQAAVPPFLHNTGIQIDSALERPGPTVDIWQIE